MKKIITALLTLLITSDLFAMENGNYLCTLYEMQAVDEDERKAHGIENGPVKKEDQDIYKISFNDRKLDFTNTANNSDAKFVFMQKDKEYKHYISEPYHMFAVSLKSNDFIFSVMKSNYHVDYVGKCKADTEKNIGYNILISNIALTILILVFIIGPYLIWKTIREEKAEK